MGIKKKLIFFLIPYQESLFTLIIFILIIMMLNPEFSTPNFQPNIEEEYKMGTSITSSITSTGFTYLMALVMSGESRLEELNEYSKTQEFKDECKKVNTAGFTPLMLAIYGVDDDSSLDIVKLLLPCSDVNIKINDGYNALTIYFRVDAFCERTAEKIVELLLPYYDDINFDWFDGLYHENLVIRIISNLQTKRIKEMKERLNERNTFKECLKDGFHLEETIITSYL